jgi:Arc/MetJ family transcription regulator
LPPASGEPERYRRETPFDGITAARWVYCNTVTTHKTTIEVDESLVERAASILGTRGLKATVHRALEEVVASEARRRLVERLRAMDGLDLDKPEVMAEAWR